MRKKGIDEKPLKESQTKFSGTRKKKRTNGKQSAESQTVFRSWSDLPNDLLRTIFNRLDHKEVLWVVSSVCRSWQFACWDVLFRKGDIFNLLELKSLCSTDAVEDNVDKMGLALRRVIESLFDRHGDILDDTHGNFQRVMFPPHLSDNHLVYVAERTVKLQHMCLNLKRITGQGFSRAIRNWRGLEVIALDSASDRHYTHIVQEIGINCRNLRILAISPVDVSSTFFHLTEYNSQVIADNLHSLKVLGLKSCYIYKLGLQTILTKCRQLQICDLRTCRRTIEEGRVTRRRKALESRPFRFVQEPLSVRLRFKDGVGWSIDKLAGTHSVETVIDLLWRYSWK